jgi:hypothetical protein
MQNQPPFDRLVILSLHFYNGLVARQKATGSMNESDRLVACVPFPCSGRYFKARASTGVHQTPALWELVTFFYFAPDRRKRPGSMSIIAFYDM